MRSTFAIVSAAAILTALALSPGSVSAKKPTPPEPPPEVDGGVIYYRLGGVLCQENSDGTGFKELTGIDGEPSHALHGDERWFLSLRTVGNSVYPSGTARQELFAVSESGTAVQLTDDASLEPDRDANLLWTMDGTVIDGKVSYVAQRWVQDSNSDWSIAEQGIYYVTLDPDDLGDAASLGLEPERLPVPCELHETVDGKFLVNTQMDWSPDGESVVYRRKYATTPGLYRSDLQSDGTWSTVFLSEGGTFPRWSRDGSRIAVDAGGIVTMAVDGSDATVVISYGKSGKHVVYRRFPKWSPSGSFLLYSEYIMPHIRPDKSYDDMCRITVDGEDPTTLSDDTTKAAFPVAWRSVD